jgi:hypothetical protein
MRLRVSLASTAETPNSSKPIAIDAAPSAQPIWSILDAMTPSAAIAIPMTAVKSSKSVL